MPLQDYASQTALLCAIEGQKRQLRHISMPFSRLEKLLKSGRDHSLEKIIRKARDMDDLTGHLRRHLSPDMAENLVAAN
ncbi:MAG TPA: hypothetical protein VIS04_08145, partial [Woeseiaceae bacterium]